MSLDPAGGEPRVDPAEVGASVQLLAFDLDGTLIDSAPDLHFSLSHALREHDLPAVTLADTLSWVGDGVEQLVRRGLVSALHRTGRSRAGAETGNDIDVDRADAAADALLPTAIASFSDCYARNLFERSTVYPGARATLESLKAAGLALACVTNKREGYALPILELAGLHDLLDFVIGGDTLPKKKPSPLPLIEAARRGGVEPARAVFVGDSVQDMRSAQAAGWPFVWARYGYRNIAPDALHAAATIDDLPSLLSLIRR